MKELPDRWYLHLAKTLRPHGRIAVISSCATAGILLIVGGVVFANSGDRTVTNLSSSPKTTVMTTPDGIRTTPKGQTPTESTTTTTAPSNPSAARATAPPETVPSNPAQPASPTTAAAPGVTTTTAAPTPSTGAPPTTAAPAPVVTSSLSVNADWTTTPTPDDPVVNLRVVANDSSGYISSIIVLWNDGSQTMVNNPNACTLPLKSSFNATVTHSYATAGTYTVAATATSTDCGGATQQQLSRLAKSVTVGGTPPTTTPPTTSTTAGP